MTVPIKRPAPIANQYTQISIVTLSTRELEYNKVAFLT
jgi:hypothetical protein